MEQAAKAVEHPGQDALGQRAGGRVAEPALDELDVPVAEVVPGEVAEPLVASANPKASRSAVVAAAVRAEQAQDPAVFDRQSAGLIGAAS